MKPLSFVQSDHIFSVIPSKAKYGMKNDYITLIKNGFLFLEFIPFIKSDFEQEKKPDWSKKEGFLLDAKKSMEFTIYDIKKKEEFEIINKYNNDERFLIIKGNKDKNNEYFVNIKYVNKVTDKQYISKLNIIDAIIMQKVIDFAFPYMLGLQAIISNKFVEEDI